MALAAPPTMLESKGEKLLWNDSKFGSRSSPAERLTSVYAEKLVEQSAILELSQAEPLVVLDNACGTGVVTQALQDRMKDRSIETLEVTCGDLVDTMLNSCKQRIQACGWTNTKAVKVDAQDTKLPSSHFTHVFTNFGPMIFPDHSAMLTETYRMLQPGGSCAFSTWKKIGWLDDFGAAFESMPDLPPLEPAKFGAAFSKGRWWEEGWIRTLMTQHGFQNVKIEAVSNISVAGDVDELRSLLQPILKIVYSFWTAEQREQHVNSNVEDRMEKWFLERYNHGPVRWHWIALLTTSSKPT